MSNIIIQDEVFNKIDWQNCELAELLGCKIVGIEPIVDGRTEGVRTVGICLTVEDPDSRLFAVELMYEPEFHEILYSKGEIKCN